MEIDEIIKDITDIDIKDYFKSSDTKELQDDEGFIKIYDNHINPLIDKKAVLGIDIYHYSQYEENRQVLIPVVFKMLINETIQWCEDDERIIFSNIDWTDYPFIDTGDGGFFLFDTPLQAYTFALNFYIQLKVFNTGHMYPKLHHFIGDITLRSCITYDDVYKMGENYYGAAIIHNSRILSTDKLDRFMIDENTNTWFNSTLLGIDRMKYFTLDQLFKEKVEENKKNNIENHSLYRATINEVERKLKTNEKEKRPYTGIESVHIQKIGTIQVKMNKLSIYNIETQITTLVSDENNEKEKFYFVTSVGNLNPSGLTI